MAVFIELTTDAFQKNMNDAVAFKKGGRAGVSSARRPLRGLEIKEDTYAFLRVVDSSGKEIPLINSSAAEDSFFKADYTNFLLQSVQEARMEKHQIVETFGEPYIFFFGESPRFLDVNAVLINSNDFNWEAEWWENYDKYFRGTRLVEQGARCYLFYDDNIVEGYMLNAQSVKVSDTPLSVTLQFRFFVTGYQNISNIGSSTFPMRSDVSLAPNLDLATSHKARWLPPTAPDPMSSLVNGNPNDPPVWTSEGYALVQKREKALQDLLNSREYNKTEKSVRGDVTDNIDEWVGGAPTPVAYDVTNNGSTPSPTQTTNMGHTEVNDLLGGLIRVTTYYGADTNSPSALLGMGMAPAFGYGANGRSVDDLISEARVGFVSAQAGLYASVSSSISFSASASVSASVSASASASFSASASVSASARAQLSLVQARTALRSSRWQLYGAMDSSVAARAGVTGSARYANGYIYNAPLVSGQSGYLAGYGGSAGVSYEAGIGGGGGVRSYRRTSAFSLMSVPGTLDPAPAPGPSLEDPTALPNGPY